MELQEEIIISAERDQVFAALNDITILQECIPSCEELVANGDKTILRCSAKAETVGKLAQLAGRLIMSTEKTVKNVFRKIR